MRVGLAEWSVVTERSNAWRLLAALGIVLTLVVQLVETIGFAQDDGRDVGTVVLNWFSFFTTVSAITAVVALIVPPRRAGGVLQICAACYTLVVGLGYNLLLRGAQGAPGDTGWWTNEVVHVVVPLVMLVDVWVTRREFRDPPRPGLSGARIIAVVLALPAVWTVYILVRGWYPYFFLDPDEMAGGPAGVGAVLLGTGLFMAVLAVILTRIQSGARRGHRGGRADGGQASGRRR